MSLCGRCWGLPEGFRLFPGIVADSGAWLRGGLECGCLVGLGRRAIYSVSMLATIRGKNGERGYYVWVILLCRDGTHEL